MSVLYLSSHETSWQFRRLLNFLDSGDVPRSRIFGFAGEIFVALFGEAAPDIFAEDAEIAEEYENRLPGFKVICINPVTHETKDFIANSFLLAFTGTILLPGATMIIFKKFYKAKELKA